MYGPQRRDVKPLSQRSSEVLKWVVRQYTDSGIPVASTHLVEMERFEVRSATLRNELNHLESDGFLHQPHTSAGRIPTETGYRYFVDHLMEPDPVVEKIQHRYERSIEAFAADLDQLIKHTSHFLADMAEALVLISRPQPRATRITGLTLHEVDADTILLVIKMSPGQVKSLTCRVATRLSRAHLSEAEQILNDHFADRELSDLDQDLEREQAEWQRRGAWINDLVHQLLATLKRPSEGEYLSYGTHQLLHYPELAPAMVLEPILASLESGQLVRELPVSADTFSAHILIGSELGRQNLNALSAVSVCYAGSQFQGMIHLFGPTRMAYERIAGMATYVADRVGLLLKESFDI